MRSSGFSITRLIVVAAVLQIMALSLDAADAAAPAATNQVAQPLEIPGIQNAFRVTEKIYSGSQPEGEAAFAALASLGVNTIVSVDGGKPDVDAARKHGLRYIHLPIGYDGVATNRVAELAKAATTLSGPIFVHCHHGLHRGPTAVAIMGEAAEGWTPNRAETWMRAAGTSADYPGLYRAAREFSPPTRARLAAITELPETARTSSLVDAMVAIDEEFGRLKAAQKTSWKSVPNQPNLVPAHTATILWEHFRELARLDETPGRPENYRANLAASKRAADQFRALLRDAGSDTAARDRAFQSLGKTCADCHKRYRN